MYDNCNPKTPERLLTNTSTFKALKMNTDHTRDDEKQITDGIAERHRNYDYDLVLALQLTSKPI